ncbi:hypothetical protein AB0B79_41450 [Streptomyces sp. NPDC039022]|uniref:hypothetical protein n=1 Tax=Streptomyces sp. NPDC039022 TaxID=3157091 RepID=UPI0033DCCEAB
MSDDYGCQVRRLETRTGSVESELCSLRSKLGEVEDLDDELRDIRGDLRSLEDDLGTVRNELTELDLVEGDRVVATVPTYRGEGRTFL